MDGRSNDEVDGLAFCKFQNRSGKRAGGDGGGDACDAEGAGEFDSNAGGVFAASG